MRKIVLLALAASLALLGGSAFAQAPNFDDPAAFAKQREELKATAMGPEGKPWEQYLSDAMADTAKFKKPGPYTLCFSNAGVNNPWRVVGWTDMQAEVDLHKDQIKEFIAVDAQGSDDKQIADIGDLLAGGKCDLLIVSPNTTAALTPAVEKACATLPVVVFDRGVNTPCPVTFVHPVGGYGFGISAGEFVAANVPKGSNVLMLRILPGVDVLETRYSAAKRIFDEAGINIIGAEFTDGDNAKTKSIVEDYIQKGKIDAVWMDAGATAVAAIEAFEDAGVDVPVFTGEDQQDFLQKWKALNLKAIAPTYPAYQWRSAIIAALKVLNGEPVPGPEWVLPQPSITQDTLDNFINEKMPPLHYAMCGCEGMPDYPARWGGK
ncbi:ABC transporter substrate-binding protein [Paradevosia shaoguanensis]|uniref:ABC transporter substrate-binding protein n=1 Tax=Paradevosia shaoguanensis TaxID=1335043 RepID=A0AA41QKG9_9HYPH|nr:ABC transporter substrate-binding protein [Paradevosia shaoguanensis]KFL27082.1 ABC transporter substrate-binding protein [Devosia sp. 17-2-E-8]MCF1741340.1 ABC transporter substrate-binding protein [Paradevosia shaoguanensis]MCI0125823.1 ABC transporter substrate-binding protein [Paradevosia shaoguanensis]CDP51173.1 Ribose ABC transporter, periplasmic ribose-bindin g protein RbsB [Devosia sp. DBB001]